MPISDDSINKILDDSDARSASTVAAAKQIDTVTKLIKVLQEEILTLDRSIKVKQLESQSTKDLEDRRKSLTSSLKDAVTKYDDLSKSLKQNTSAQHMNYIELNQAYQLYTSLSKQVVLYAKDLDDLVYKYTQQKMAISLATQQVAGFTKSISQVETELKGVRQALNLTRQEYVGFLSTWTRSQDLGLKTEQVTALAKKLIELRGAAQGLKELETLGNISQSSGMIQRALAGDNAARISMARNASREQRFAMRDAFSEGIPGAPGTASNRQSAEVLIDNLKTAFSSTLEKTFGPLAGLLGPTGTMATGLAANLYQLMAIRSVLQTISGQVGIGSAAGIGAIGAGIGAIGAERNILLRNLGVSTSPSSPNFIKSTITPAAQVPISINNLAPASRMAGIGRFMKSPGGLMLGGMALGMGSEMLGEGSKPGEFRHAASRVGSLGGNILNYGGTGALLGSMAGPGGTAAGAGIGAVVGIGVGVKNIYDEVKGIRKDTKESPEGPATAENITQIRAKLREDLAFTRRDYEGSLGGMRGATAGLSAQKGMRGTMGARLKAGEELMDITGGARAYNIEEINEKRANLLKRQAKGEKDLGPLFDELKASEEELTQDFINAFSKLPTISDAVADAQKDTKIMMEGLNREVMLSQHELSIRGTLDGTNRSIERFYWAKQRSLDGEINSSLDEYEKMRTVFQHNKKILENRIYSNISTEGIKEAARKELAHLTETYQSETQILEAKRKMLELEKQENETAAMRAQATSFRNNPDYVQAVSSGSIGRAQAGLADVQGNRMGSSYSQINQGALEEARLAAENYRTQQPLLESTMKLQVANGNLEQAEKTRLQLMDLYLDAMSKQTNAIRVNRDNTIDLISREQKLGDMRKSLLEMELEKQQTLGSSYSVQFELQDRIVREQIEGHKKTGEIIRSILESVGGDVEKAGRLPEYQKEILNYKREEVDITKSVTGKQRDFLDKTLGRAYGIPSGSRVQPLLNQRNIFPDGAMKGPGGIWQGMPNMDMTIPGRENLLRSVIPGARRLNAPGFGQGGAIDFQKSDFTRTGFIGGEGPKGDDYGIVRSPDEQRARARSDQAVKVDVNIKLDSSLLSAEIRKEITQSLRRGSV